MNTAGWLAGKIDEHIAKLTAERDEWKRTASSRQTRTSELLADNERLRAELAKSEASRLTFADDEMSYTKEIANLKARVQELEAELADCEDSLADWSST